MDSCGRLVKTFPVGSVVVHLRLLLMYVGVVSDVRLPVLDMKSGYSRMPRKIFLEVMSRVLPNECVAYFIRLIL